MFAQAIESPKLDKKILDIRCSLWTTFFCSPLHFCCTYLGHRNSDKWNIGARKSTMTEVCRIVKERICLPGKRSE